MCYARLLISAIVWKQAKNTNLATPSKKACYPPQAYIVLNEANNFKICSSSGGTSEKERQGETQFIRKIDGFPSFIATPTSITVNVLFCRFFLKNLTLFMCSVFLTLQINSIAIVFQLFLGTSQRSCVSQSVPLCL